MMMEFTFQVLKGTISRLAANRLKTVTRIEANEISTSPLKSGTRLEVAHVHSVDLLSSKIYVEGSAPLGELAQ